MAKRRKAKSWDKRDPWKVEKPDSAPALPSPYRVYYSRPEPAEHSPAGIQAPLALLLPANAGVLGAYKYGFEWATSDPDTFWIDDDGHTLRYGDGPDDFVTIYVGGGIEEFLGGEVGRVEIGLVNGGLAVMEWSPGRLRDTCRIMVQP